VMELMRQAPHVCVVTSIHPDYDARVYKHCLSVARLGFQTTLVSPWAPLRDEPFQFLRFPRSPGLLGRVKQMAAVARLALRADADIYHFHDIDLLPLFTLIRLVTGKPVVYDIHENYSEEMLVRYWVPRALRIPLYWAVHYGQRMCCSVIRNVVAVVDRILADVGGPWLHAIQIRNFASVDLARSAKDDYARREPGVLFLGSQYVENGSFLFLDIAERVLRRRRDIRFYSIDRFGSNLALRDKIVAEIARRGLEQHVTMLPNVLPHDVMGHVNRCMIGLSPNLDVPKQRRAIPTKLFEYMAGGIPIVASDLPYNRRYVGQTGAGLLADPADPETFADAICRLTDDRVAARRMGQAGRQAFLRRFCWESQERTLHEFYDGILTRSGGRGPLPRHGCSDHAGSMREQDSHCIPATPVGLIGGPT
jgi:glycosyltransferase involved in cell wall biosynthesis